MYFMQHVLAVTRYLGKFQAFGAYNHFLQGFSKYGKRQKITTAGLDIFAQMANIQGLCGNFQSQLRALKFWHMGPNTLSSMENSGTLKKFISPLQRKLYYTKIWSVVRQSKMIGQFSECNQLFVRFSILCFPSHPLFCW